MVEVIEVRAFMELSTVFKERNWAMPHCVALSQSITGLDLLALLDINREKVEVIFINGKAYAPDHALIRPGDRVALVPAGTPGPYRVLMGFVKCNESHEHK